ncbi:MAG: cytochrome P450 [Streptosporangiales bacterium]|nr:cytochrome P450 [Streptosporangiales bacterium]
MTSTQLRRPASLPADTDLDAVVSSGAFASAVDPYPVYRRLQRDYPVLDLFGAVSVFRYDDVAAVLRHPQVSTDDRNSTLHRSLQERDKLTAPYLSQMDDRSFLRRDPPEHTRLRKLVAKSFTRHRIKALRSFIQRHVDDVLDKAAARGQLELVADLAYPLPIDVISELLGIPDEDRAFVATWPRTQLCCTFESGSLKAAADLQPTGPDSPRQAEADRIQQQLTDYFTLLIERRRRDPGDDVVSALVAAEEHGEHLTHDEINATLRLLFVAGYENAVNLIGHGTLALLRHPDQWAAVGDNPALASRAVDEALRYDAPFQFTTRIALADLDIGGYHIGRGQHILAWIAAANRDPAHFTDPDRFDIGRTDDRHLAFGTGIHACLGGPLAHMEAEIAFTTLTRRLGNPRLDTDPPRYRADVFRSLEALPISADIKPAA